MLMQGKRVKRKERCRDVERRCYGLTTIPHFQSLCAAQEWEGRGVWDEEVKFSLGKERKKEGVDYVSIFLTTYICFNCQ